VAREREKRRDENVRNNLVLELLHIYTKPILMAADVSLYNALTAGGSA